MVWYVKYTMYTKAVVSSQHIYNETQTAGCAGDVDLIENKPFKFLLNVLTKEKGPF